jgi:hypothetical protein
MTHFAVLRHGFDIRRNPDRLGPPSDERFCLALNSSGDLPGWLDGNVVWLISWEGFMKTHHVICGWFTVSHVGKGPGVVARHQISGDDGELFARGVGPLEIHPWFHKFVDANRKFRDGEPTDLGESAAELLALARGAGYRVPAGPAWDQVSQGPASM